MFSYIPFLSFIPIFIPMFIPIYRSSLVGASYSPTQPALDILTKCSTFGSAIQSTTERLSIYKNKRRAEVNVSLPIIVRVCVHPQMFHLLPPTGGGSWWGGKGLFFLLGNSVLAERRPPPTSDKRLPHVLPPFRLTRQPKHLQQGRCGGSHHLRRTLLQERGVHDNVSLAKKSH